MRKPEVHTFKSKFLTKCSFSLTSHSRETPREEESPKSSTPSPPAAFITAGALSAAVPGFTALKYRGKSPNGSLESWELQGTLTSHPSDPVPAGIPAPASSPSVSPGCTQTCVGCGQQFCRSLRSQHQLSPKYQCFEEENTINPSLLLLLTLQKLL